MIPAPSSLVYRTILRMVGIALCVTGVMFHRRGVMDWREPAFVTTSVLLQEAFLALSLIHISEPTRPY